MSNNESNYSLLSLGGLTVGFIIVLLAVAVFYILKLVESVNDMKDKVDVFIVRSNKKLDEIDKLQSNVSEIAEVIFGATVPLACDLVQGSTNNCDCNSVDEGMKMLCEVGCDLCGDN
jgi:hypothetical protein